MPDQMAVSELIEKGRKVLILTKNFDKTSIKVWKTADLYQWIQQVKSVLNPPILPQRHSEGLYRSKISCPIQWDAQNDSQARPRLFSRKTCYLTTFLRISGQIFTLLSMLFVKKTYFWTTVHHSEYAIRSDLKFPLIWDTIWFNSYSQVKTS